MKYEVHTQFTWALRRGFRWGFVAGFAWGGLVTLSAVIVGLWLWLHLLGFY